MAKLGPGAKSAVILTKTNNLIKPEQKFWFYFLYLLASSMLFNYYFIYSKIFAQFTSIIKLNSCEVP